MHTEKIIAIAEPKEIKPVVVVEKQPIVKEHKPEILPVDNIQNDKVIQEKVITKQTKPIQIEKPIVKSVDFKTPTKGAIIVKLQPPAKQLTDKSNDTKSEQIQKPLLRSTSDNGIKVTGVKKLRETFEAAMNAKK